MSTEDQQYDVTAAVNEIRRLVDQWRKIPSPSDWGVTPETARLLLHWRQHKFSHYRPFFCQVEAAETLIWLRRGLGRGLGRTNGASCNGWKMPTTRPTRGYRGRR